MEFFLREVWPLLQALSPKLHIIAGQRYPYFLERYQKQLPFTDSMKVEEFVGDVRPAYRAASVVIAPLTASAGTNIKIMEAMAMGKAIVSTSAGVNGLALHSGRDVVIADSPAEFADAIQRLLTSPEERMAMEHAARQTACANFSWLFTAEQQRQFYRTMADA